MFVKHKSANIEWVWSSVWILTQWSGGVGQKESNHKVDTSPKWSNERNGDYNPEQRNQMNGDQIAIIMETTVKKNN